jgi:hypothetical protein
MAPAVPTILPAARQKKSLSSPCAKRASDASRFARDLITKS